MSSLPQNCNLKSCLGLVANPERLYRLTKIIYSDKEFELFNKIKKNIDKQNLKWNKNIRKK